MAALLSQLNRSQCCCSQNTSYSPNVHTGYVKLSLKLHCHVAECISEFRSVNLLIRTDKYHNNQLCLFKTT